MNPLDMHTMIFSSIVSNAICMGIMTALWWLNRKQNQELGYWLADFILQFTAILLIGLQGIVPELFSMVISNSLLVGGTFLLLEGLARYLRKNVRQIQNILYLALFIAIQYHFTFQEPNLTACNINISIGLIFSCGQCAWLMLSGKKNERNIEKNLAGSIFVAYAVLSAVRILIDCFTPRTNDFFKSGFYDSLVILIFQMLWILLTLSLLLIVNRKLFDDLETDIALRKKAEEKLKTSEEKFFAAFQNHPDAIAITAIEDGRIIEANQNFYELSGHCKAETVGRTTVELKMWVDAGEREKYVRHLRQYG